MAENQPPLLLASFYQHASLDSFIRELSDANFLVEHISLAEADWADRILSLPEATLVLLVSELQAHHLTAIESIHGQRSVAIVVIACSHTLAVSDIVAAGVHAYLDEPVRPDKLPLIASLADARFKMWRSLSSELKLSQQKLSERKLIEKAKGVLMEQKKISEQQAYDQLRRTAMNQGQTMAVLASRIVSVVEIFD